MKKILLIEDVRALHKNFVDSFANQAEIISAYTVRQGYEKFASHQDADIIVMDSCLEELEPDTLQLTEHIRRKGFRGPMVASSYHSEYRHQQLSAGCDLVWESPNDIIRWVKKLLDKK
ncbi:MAG: response regulator [Candidatus Falkowbacteria bacterium]